MADMNVIFVKYPAHFIVGCDSAYRLAAEYAAQVRFIQILLDMGKPDRRKGLCSSFFHAPCWNCRARGIVAILLCNFTLREFFPAELVELGIFHPQVADPA